MRRLVLLAGCLAAALAGPWGAPGAAARDRADCFEETGFCIEDRGFRDYFRTRGGARTFGHPISREFTLLGSQVQFFRSHVLQRAADGRVGTLNLLDEGLMPATGLGGSVLPEPDPAIVSGTPGVGKPGYAERIVEFTRRHAPNEWGGRPVRFLDTFEGTVDLATAFPDGGGDPALLPLLSLEIWGAVTSPPTADPADPEVVYQRYQRAIMRYREGCRCTEPVPLAEWFKAVIVGEGLPEDLARDMASSRFIYQYRPGAARWLARPLELPETDLTEAFAPQLPGRALTGSPP